MDILPALIEPVFEKLWDKLIQHFPPSCDQILGIVSLLLFALCIHLLTLRIKTSIDKYRILERFHAIAPELPKRHRKATYRFLSQFEQDKQGEQL